MPEEENERSLSALPSRLARALAFAAIIAGGGLGGLVGYAVVKVQCHGSCSVPRAGGVFGGSIVCAAGSAIVVVLGLRAMGEWREVNDKR